MMDMIFPVGDSIEVSLSKDIPRMKPCVAPTTIGPGVGEVGEDGLAHCPQYETGQLRKVF